MKVDEIAFRCSMGIEVGDDHVGGDGGKDMSAEWRVQILSLKAGRAPAL